jgi:HEAT repeat protein
MLLELIWQGSIVLSLGSIALLIILFIRRLFIQAAEARLEKRRIAIKARVISYISAATPQSWPRSMSSTSDERILLGIASELLQSVTGSMRTRILTLLNTAIDLDRMLLLLRKGKTADRAKVAARFFWSQNPAVHEELQKALSDKDPEVVLAAANSLIGVGQPINLATLLPLMKARDMLDHRGVRDLIRHLAPNNTSAMADMITGDDHDVTVLALDSLGPRMDPILSEAIKAVAVLHRDKDVRAAAVRALGNGGIISAASVIAEALDDLTWEVRVQAAVAAGRLKIVAMAPQLARCLESDSWWLQWRAAQALAKLGPIGERFLREVPFDSPAAVLADVALAEIHTA